MKHTCAAILIFAAASAAAPAMAQRAATSTVTPAATSSAAPVVPTSERDAVPLVPAAAPVDAGKTGTAAAPAPAGSDTTTAPNPRGPVPMTVPQSAPSAGGGLFQTTLALAFVIALLLGGAWILKRFSPRSFGGGNSNVKLVGALNVGARERILVVEVGEQWIVVGASPGRMNALATMARQETAEAPAPATLPGANFAEWIKQTIDKRNGK